MNQPKTTEERRNATVICALYASAEAVAKDTPKFVSMFREGGFSAELKKRTKRQSRGGILK